MMALPYSQVTSCSIAGTITAMLRRFLVPLLFTPRLICAQQIQGEVTVHEVNVGRDRFFPDSIVANPDDIVTFVFRDGNHSVIQSMYGWPCVPRAAITGVHGFHSGKQGRSHRRTDTD